MSKARETVELSQTIDATPSDQLKFEQYGSGTYTGNTAYVLATTSTGEIIEIPEPAASGATGGGTDEIFWENKMTVTTDYTISTGKNALTAGPITIANGVTVTIPTGQSWVVV